MANRGHGAFGEDKMKRAQVINMPVAKLRRYQNNPRRNDDAVNYVVNSIKAFGFRVPIVIDRNNVIVAGDTRYKAAKKIGMKTVPCIVAEDLSEEKINAFRLVDNKTQELSSWDYARLMDELAAVQGNFDMSEFGFDTSRLDDGEDEDKEDNAHGRTSNLDEGYEVNVDDFGEEKFAYECPCCGFRFNE